MHAIIPVILSLSTAIGMPAASEAKTECLMEMDFKGAASGWAAVNDGVMGGKSSGGSNVQNSLLVFEGVLNTDGGGFSSVRTPVSRGDLAGADGLTMRVKSDGRAYRITMQTDKKNLFRPVSFNSDIPVTAAGEWETVTARFDTVKASVWGRSLSGVNFDPAKINELGIIIADGRDGPFRLEVDWIKACNLP